MKMELTKQNMKKLEFAEKFFDERAKDLSLEFTCSADSVKWGLEKGYRVGTIRRQMEHARQSLASYRAFREECHEHGVSTDHYDLYVKESVQIIGACVRRLASLQSAPGQGLVMEATQ